MYTHVTCFLIPTSGYRLTEAVVWKLNFLWLLLLFEQLCFCSDQLKSETSIFQFLPPYNSP